jgi:hypothetical protein
MKSAQSYVWRQPSADGNERRHTHHVEHPRQEEKYRTISGVGGGAEDGEGSAVVCLDETPLGAFVEIVGSPETIAAMAGRLSLPLAEAIVSSYPRLYELYRQEHPVAPAFMVFPESSPA